MTREERLKAALEWATNAVRVQAFDAGVLLPPARILFGALVGLRADIEELREEVERLKGLDATILAVRQALGTPSFVPVEAHVQALVQATFLRETQRRAAAPAADPEAVTFYVEPVPQNLGWYCPDSPDKRCHYFSHRDENGMRVVRLGSAELGNEQLYVMDVDGRDENECLFCGEAKERK